MKTTPVAKLAAPRQAIRIRNPVGPSERCGVRVAEKIGGSLRGSLSEVMAVIIKKDGQKDDRAADQGGEERQGRYSQRPAQTGRRGRQGGAWRTAAMDPCRGR